MVYSSFLIISLLFVVARAANDWSTPCFQGECSYDLPASAGPASGTVKISGSPNAITDITTAAGWTILSCAPDVLAQDIRLVCNSDDASSSGCDNLYQNTGAVGKLVRLPENCGKSAFARISNSWVPADQSIPSSIAARLVRRDGSRPQVKALSLDTNFSAVDVSKTGSVSITIQGATVPGANSSTVTPQRRAHLANRSFLGSVGDLINDVTSNSFNVNKTQDLPPIDVDKTFNVFNQTISCPPAKASVNVNVDANAHAVVTLGIAASGTIIPPKFDDFGVFAGFTADLNGSLDMVADLSGTLDSGEITLFEVGIPGLDFPGIFTLGPSFQINAQATATLDLNVDLNVGLNYHISNAQLFFPPSQGQNSGGSFDIGDTPLKLSLSPSITATGTIEAHLIPTINLGLQALGDKVDASVFVNLDTSAILSLTLQASASTGVTLGDNSTTSTVSKSTASSIASSAGPQSSTVKRSYVPPYGMPYARAATTIKHNSIDASSSQHGKASSTQHEVTSTSSVNSELASTSPAASSSHKSASSTISPVHSTTAIANATSTAQKSANTGVVATTGSTSSFGGCVDLQAGLDVNAGATGDFFGLFDASTKVNLFSKRFELFKKCFGSGVSRRRVASRFFRRSSLETRSLGLTCPAPDVTDATSVVDESLKAASIGAA